MLLVSSDPIAARYCDPLPMQEKTHEKDVGILLENNQETYPARLENLRMSSPSDSKCSPEYETTDGDSCAELTAGENTADSDD